MDATVGELGEFALIDAITARLGSSAAVLLGPGDDAAIVAAPDGRVVASTDVLVEGRHFRRNWSDARDVGHRAAAANLSDIAAMGAVPTALLVGLATPPDLPASWALEMAEGLREECDLVGASVAGGDVVRSDTLVISVTALGSLEGREPVTRSGAQPGDLVAVAGRLGWAAAGLAVLTRGFRSPRVLVDALRRPAPPYAEGPRAAALGATAMVDVSDGLVSDLGHIAVASGVALRLSSDAFHVPQEFVDTARALNADPMAWLLAGGDDHALAATFPPDVDLPMAWSVVGRVEDGEGLLVDGEPYAGPGGWTSFA
ncbi:MAG: thiamine-monophosphate kinase [Actinomycetota bacterium]|jgi:thiamine-monophosphate kinase|nr:thiamine-monophosphate kinase [Actinomycetota bacterium]